MTNPTLAEKLLEETKQVLLAQGRRRAVAYLVPPRQVEVSKGHGRCLLCEAKLKGWAIYVGSILLDCLMICPNRPECRKRILEQQETQQRALEKGVIL